LRITLHYITRPSYFSSNTRNSTCRLKTLFAMVNKLTNPPQHVISGSGVLVNSFSQFFSDKLKPITESITKDTPHTSDSNVNLNLSDSAHSTNSLSALTLTTPVAIRDLIVKSNSTSCRFDPTLLFCLKENSGAK